VNVINISLAAIIRPDPKSAKNTMEPSVFFALLRSEFVKADCKIYVKSTPEGDNTPSVQSTLF